MTQTAILITGHYLHSRRRAGFHWIAEALHDRGWRVIMMTAPISWLSWLNRDHRMQYDLRRQAGTINWSDDHLGSYVWWTPMHPVSLKFKVLNRVARPLFDRFEHQPLGAIESEIRNADCFIFESTPALVLAQRFRSLNERARMVYRVSDDLCTLRVHPTLHDRELQLAPLFDRISSPTQSIHRKFEHLQSAHQDSHGAPIKHFERCTESPYKSGTTNAVFVGVSRLDRWFVDVASRARRDVDFHLIGPLGSPSQIGNVHYHGELPFDETVPFVKFADVGLQTIVDGPGVESFADSLKMMQYSWCRLPIIAPKFIHTERSNVVSYTPGDDMSAVQSLKAALELPRRDEWRAGVCGWDDLVRRLIGEDENEQPAATIDVVADQSRMHSAR